MNRAGSTKSGVAGKRGTALLLVLVLLFLLSAIGIAFVSSATLERHSARTHLDGQRAKLAARSGVEQGRALLEALVDENLFEAFLPAGPAAGPARPYTIERDGSLRIVRPVGGGTYVTAGDTYETRVYDANSRIFLNEGLAGGAQDEGSQNLKRILNALGAAVGSAKVGDRIMACRPAVGFRSREELLPILGRVDYEKLRRHVTVNAWVDDKVVNPVPLSADVLAAYPVHYNESIRSFRYGRSLDAYRRGIDSPLKFAPEFADPLDNAHVVVALDEVNAQWIQRGRRAPVNVNLASPEVLTAMITGLKGWYISGRRKRSPGGDMYTLPQYPPADYDPEGAIGDEYGYLYSTDAFRATGETSDGGIPASRIADEIIACRTRAISPSAPTLDYAQASFGGPFRTWSQFHAFCDALVKQGIVRDTRGQIFFDFMPANGKLQASEVQGWLAAQAMADVLKANFNPNFTPNEINPDASLYLVVDKTDLICHSTEFCFTPMGVFDIEAEGRIRAPELAGGIAAFSVARASLKLFDAVRQTTQAEFEEGTLGKTAISLGRANSGTSLEAGPEPGVGPAPQECRWSGWLQLATVGADRRPAPGGAPTGRGKPEHGETMRAHFRYDTNLDYAATDPASRAMTATAAMGNIQDRTESVAGPYAPLAGKPGLHRLGRDWARMEGEGAPANHISYAPADLRMDGIYVERGSAVMWPLNRDTVDDAGTVAFWYKPSYRPELTGTPRTLFCMDYYDRDPGMEAYRSPINAIWFLPFHDHLPGKMSPGESGLPTYPYGPWRPMSLLAGFSTDAGGIGTITPSLNHRFHDHEDREDVLSHHGWIHVAYSWDMQNLKASLRVNGEELSGMAPIEIHPSPTTIDRFLPAPDGTGPQNAMRLGDANYRVPKKAGRSRNLTADGTFDEFYHWKGTHLDRAQDLFAAGRYLPPQAAAKIDFTSGEMQLGPRSNRQLPVGRNVDVSSAVARTTKVMAPETKAKIIGAAWTCYTPDRGAEGQPLIADHLRNEMLNVSVTFALKIAGSAPEGKVSGDGRGARFSAEVPPGQPVQYTMSLVIDGACDQSIFLGTPVIDDVTLYVRRGTEDLCWGEVLLPQ